MVGEDSHGITNIIEKLIVIVAGFFDPLFFSSHQELLKNSHLILNDSSICVVGTSGWDLLF